ncbi:MULTISPECIES: helical backbone metal receptor [unclassified Duganella]|uniref:helical backbone metal receptor n=1 Tax=unclassified Duganella TaxID=2636909 RepID=UPI00088C9F6A|nr:MULTISPECIES: helical backbone metal receptor [unclassified Duganella]SDH08707.1 ABC-type Fe3+-hydroxamate transport system, substrate-binding protein [Duganella sp. OV458]SDK17482.1 ABC-type Fe3+-hydroxamate transport system, substrate-binding protein [Duganella sp. OV510]
MAYTDALGSVHQPDPDARIVSLVPSITELLCDLGLAQQVVGRTGFCIHPWDVVQDIPKVGGTKDVNLEKIRQLAPTHVVLNIDENEKPTADALAGFVPHIIVTHPLRPHDNVGLAQLMGGVFCREQQAADWCAAFEAEYALLQATPKGPPQTMLYCVWQDPWMTISNDTYIARMLAEIGWSAPALGAERYPAFRWSRELIDSIDGVLLSSEPYRFTEAHADVLERQIGKPVLLVDGEMMSWYGSRSLQGLTYLRELARR